MIRTSLPKNWPDTTTDRFQASTDQFQPYKTAILEVSDDVDFAQLIKYYAGKDDHRYSPGEVIATDTKRRCGNPGMDKVCTSHVECQHLTVRMQNRRMTRLTNAFSKKWANHAAAMARHFAYFNFCRPHQTLTKDRDTNARQQWPLDLRITFGRLPSLWQNQRRGSIMKTLIRLAIVFFAIWIPILLIGFICTELIIPGQRERAYQLGRVLGNFGCVLSLVGLIAILAKAGKPSRPKTHNDQESTP